MKRLRTVLAVVVLVVFVAGLAVFWRAPGTGLPDLLPGEELQLARVLRACRSGQLEEISYGHTEAVVAIGGRAVPHIAAELAQWRRGRPEAASARGAVLVDILWRIARRLPTDVPWRAEALDGICVCLRPDYRSAATAEDRKVAAAALVALGASERVPVIRRLLDALQDQRTTDPGLVNYLERAVAALRGAKRRVSSPPSLWWLPLPDGTWKRGFCDPLAGS